MEKCVDPTLILSFSQIPLLKLFKNALHICPGDLSRLPEMSQTSSLPQGWSVNLVIDAETHTIHGTNLPTWMLIFMVNVGKYTPYMDGTVCSKKNHPNYIDDSQSITYIYIYVYIYILAISDDRLLELGVLVSRFHDTSITNPHRNIELFSSQFLGAHLSSYCWWKKSCTTWDGWNPKRNGIIIILGGAGFCPSRVSCLVAQTRRLSVPPSYILNDAGHDVNRCAKEL